jgi:hypothetical protein
MGRKNLKLGFPYDNSWLQRASRNWGLAINDYV